MEQGSHLLLLNSASSIDWAELILHSTTVSYIWRRLIAILSFYTLSQKIHDQLRSLGSPIKPQCHLKQQLAPT